MWMDGKKGFTLEMRTTNLSQTPLCLPTSSLNVCSYFNIDERMMQGYEDEYEDEDWYKIKESIIT